MTIPAQVPPGVDPVQWHSVVPNDLSWQMLAGLFVAMAALLTYGMLAVIRRWRTAGWIKTRAALLLEVFVYGSAPAFGMLGGWLFWHWGAGLCFATVGSWASPWFMKFINRYAERRLARKSQIGDE